MTSCEAPGLVILADDLTGAADSGARAVGAGLPATLFLTPPTLPLPAGATAYTSDSRHLTPAQAADAIRRAVGVLRSATGMVWYKKIDSTLRGNLGSELEALLQELGLPWAIICPAFPAQGRGLQDGRLVAPTTEQHGADLPALLTQQCRLPVELVPLPEVRSGSLVDALRRRVARGVRLLVLDALTEDDLQRIRDAAGQALSGALFCGSAGLVGVLARHLAAADPGPRAPHALPGRPTLLVVGSGSRMAHRQIQAVVRHVPSLWHRELGPDPLLRSPGLPGEDAVLLLHLPPPPEGAILDGPGARQRAHHLAASAVRVAAHFSDLRLILVGGDTAMLTLQKLGIRRLQVHAELMPGIPLCQGQDPEGRLYSVVLKPGSFGDEMTLVELIAADGPPPGP